MLRLNINATVALAAAWIISSADLPANAQACTACSEPASPICPIDYERLGKPFTVRGCEASVTSNWNEGDKSETCNASVPRGTALLNPVHTIISRNHGDFSISRYTVGSIKYSQEVDEVYKSLYELALEIDATYAAHIKQEWERHRKIAEQWEGTDDAARLIVTAKGSGDWWDRWRGWSHSRLDLEVVCIAPANLPEQLAQKMSFDKYAAQSVQYVSLSNDTGTGVFGLAQPLPLGETNCSAAIGPSSGFEVSPAKQLNFRVNEDPNKVANEGMCVVLGKKEQPGFADFSKACLVRTKGLALLNDAKLNSCFVN